MQPKAYGIAIAWTLANGASGTDNLCERCYPDPATLAVYVGDTLSHVFKSPQGMEEISCSVCGECVQDGPETYSVESL